MSQLPIILGLDTSTAAFAAAITRGTEVVAHLESFADRNHSVHSVLYVQQLLQEANIQPADISALAIGHGPGSYTGMRIAVTIGKTLAWTWQKPLLAISSLEGLAFGGQSPSADEATTHWIVPLMDARRGQVYTALFASDSVNPNPLDCWQRLAVDGVRLMANWVDELCARVEQGERPATIRCVGEIGVHSAEVQRLQQVLASYAISVEAVETTMSGAAMARLGTRDWEAQSFVEVHSFAPNYTQLTEAEVKLNQKRGEQG